MELAQLSTIIQALITIKCVKIGAKSERELEKLDETEEIYFAENMPEYLFTTIKERFRFILGGTLLCLKHEGGGRRMYLINRMVRGIFKLN